MTTAWAHLPNAVHIDRIITSMKANSASWFKLSTEPLPAYWRDIHASLWTSVLDAGMTDIGYATYDDLTTPRITAEAAAPAWGAILALLVHVDCSYMLDSDPKDLAILATLGDHRAVMMLSACIVFAEEKDSA